MSVVDMVDDVVDQEKFVDEEWILSIDWTTALGIGGNTITGTVTCTAFGVELLSTVQQIGNISTVKIGGGSGIPGNSDRLHFLAPISTTEKLGYNLGTPTRSI